MKKFLLIAIALSALMIQGFAGTAEEYFKQGLRAYDSSDFPRAANFFEKACEGGNAAGCSNLGFLYANGRGVRQSYAKAAKLYKKACEGGDAKSCYNLGISYANGQGVRQNYSIAKDLFGKACDMGFELGCKNYAILNKQGY